MADKALFPALPGKIQPLAKIRVLRARWKLPLPGEYCQEYKNRPFDPLQGNVQRFIERGSVATCKVIAEKVAGQAERIIQQKGVGF